MVRVLKKLKRFTEPKEKKSSRIRIVLNAKNLLTHRDFSIS